MSLNGVPSWYLPWRTQWNYDRTARRRWSMSLLEKGTYGIQVKIATAWLKYSVKHRRVTSVNVDIGNVYIMLKSNFIVGAKSMLTEHVRNKNTQTTPGVSKDIAVQTAAQETNQSCMFMLRHRNLWRNLSIKIIYSNTCQILKTEKVKFIFTLCVLSAKRKERTDEEWKERAVRKTEKIVQWASKIYISLYIYMNSYCVCYAVLEK
jgi:hypothetical protein